MGARTKLNEICFYGATFLAALFGLLFGSWTVFWLVLLLSLGAALSDGGIRLKPTRHR